RTLRRPMAASSSLHLRLPAESLRDQISEGEHEQADADHAVGVEDCAVAAAEVTRPRDAMLVDEHARGEQHAEPPPPFERSGDSEPNKGAERHDVNERRGL